MNRLLNLGLTTFNIKISNKMQNRPVTQIVGIFFECVIQKSN